MFQNRATLIGFLGKDAEVRTTQNAKTTFTVLSLATKQSWKDRETGERQSRTTWHRCIVWGKLGEFAATLTKGAHVQIEGEIRSRDYVTKSGAVKAAEAKAKRTVTQICVTSIAKLERPKNTQAAGTPDLAAQEVPF